LSSLLIAVGVGVLHQPARVVEQHAHGDLVAARDEPRQPVLDRVIERQLALADEPQEDGVGEDLAHARNLPAVGRLHRRLRVGVLDAGGGAVVRPL